MDCWESDYQILVLFVFEMEECSCHIPWEVIYLNMIIAQGLYFCEEEVAEVLLGVNCQHTDPIVCPHPFWFSDHFIHGGCDFIEGDNIGGEGS